MSEKTKEELLTELSEAQKMLEEKAEIKGHMIRNFQMLIADKGLYSQIIDFFPYPIAIFTPQFMLVMVNKALVEKTNTRFKDFEKGTCRILTHRAHDTQLAIAVRQVFTGETFFLRDLKNPLSVFSENRQQSNQMHDCFSKAVIFPVPAEKSTITHGVIVFIP